MGAGKHDVENNDWHINTECCILLIRIACAAADLQYQQNIINIIPTAINNMFSGQVPVSQWSDF
jgi:hypothetical protein